MVISITFASKFSLGATLFTVSSKFVLFDCIVAVQPHWEVDQNSIKSRKRAGNDGIYKQMLTNR